MRAPEISELVKKFVNDDVFRVWVVWIYLVINSVLVISVIAEEIVALSWVVVRLDSVGSNIPSVEKWPPRFFTTNDTGFTFILAWGFGFYHAALIAKSNPCREDYIRSLIGWRRFMKKLPRAGMYEAGLFFNVELSSEESGHRLCICGSQFI